MRRVTHQFATRLQASLQQATMSYVSDILSKGGITMSSDVVQGNHLRIGLKLLFNRVLAGTWYLDYSVLAADFIHYTDSGYDKNFSEITLHMNQKNSGDINAWDSRCIVETAPSPKKLTILPYGWNTPYDGVSNALQPLGARVRAIYENISQLNLDIIFGEDDDINFLVRLPTDSDNWLFENREGAARVSLLLTPLGGVQISPVVTNSAQGFWHRARTAVVRLLRKRRKGHTTATETQLHLMAGCNFPEQPDLADDTANGFDAYQRACP